MLAKLVKFRKKKSKQAEEPQKAQNPRMGV